MFPYSPVPPSETKGGLSAQCQGSASLSSRPAHCRVQGLGLKELRL